MRAAAFKSVDTFMQCNGKHYSLRGVTMVIVEHPTESLPPPNLTGVFTMHRIAHDEAVTEPLVMAFKMIMRRKFLNRFSQ